MAWPDFLALNGACLHTQVIAGSEPAVPVSPPTTKPSPSEQVGFTRARPFDLLAFHALAIGRPSSIALLLAYCLGQSWQISFVFEATICRRRFEFLLNERETQHIAHSA